MRKRRKQKYDLLDILNKVRRQRRYNKAITTATLAVTAFAIVTSRIECNNLSRKIDDLEVELRRLRRRQEGK